MEYLFKKEKKSIRTKKDEIQENFERERREGDKKMSRRDEEVRRGHDAIGVTVQIEGAKVEDDVSRYTQKMPLQS